MCLKSNLTCPQCDKIYKEPISLPCGHTLCKKHLSDSNIINCFPCRKNFIISKSQFMPNYVVKNLIDDHDFLSLEEKCLRDEIEESYASLNELNEHFQQLHETFQTFELEFHEHFQEIRRQIDIHREEDKINSINNKKEDVCLSMIDRIKVFEKENFHKFNKLIEDALTYKMVPLNLEVESLNLRELFRDPDLDLALLKQMKWRESANVFNLTKNINQMEYVREQLKSNTFKPEFLDEAANGNLGALKLNAFRLSLSNSVILNETQAFGLMELCEFSQDTKLRLLYRGSRDGFKAKIFHFICDDHSNTLTNETGFIFGGFTNATHNSYRDLERGDDEFLFSFTNKENLPCKMDIQRDVPDKKGFYFDLEYGPRFGKGDLELVCNRGNKMRGSSDLGRTYQHPLYDDASNDAKCFLAGSRNFLISEIEVFHLVSE
jgi:hypothetical protein